MAKHDADRSHARTDGHERLRAICLALPETHERETWGSPTFRVRDRIFAMASARDGRPSLWCKAPPGSQTILVGADPDRFFVPPYVGPKGWIGMRLDRGADWTEVDSLVRRSYRLIAPKRLATQMTGAPPGAKVSDDPPGSGPQT